MGGDPVVAVVIPLHDTPAAFVREAIESVQGQRDPRWELVVSLDAATEESARVARDMASLDPARIRVVGAEGGTPRRASAARNLGVAHTRAPVLGFLDADDVLEPEWLGVRLSMLEAHPEVAMVYGPSVYWHSWDPATDASDEQRDWVPPLGVAPHIVHPPLTLVAPFINGAASVPVPCSILVRRWAFEAVGGFDETSRELYEDQALYTSLALRFPLLADDRTLDRYRQHRESATARAGRGTWQARLDYLDWLERQMVALSIEDATIRRSLARERWKVRHPSLARLARLPRRVATRLRAALGNRARAPAPPASPGYGPSR